MRRWEATAIEALIATADGARRDPNEIGPMFYSLVIALREIGPVLLAVDDADLADRVQTCRGRPDPRRRRRAGRGRSHGGR